MNFSGNDLGEPTERFINLEKFLSRNESCKNLILNDCQISTVALTQISLGLSKNTKLKRLVLQGNDIAERDSVQRLVRGLLDNTEGSQLTELDLAKNRITSDAIEPFVNLFEQNYKIRTLNLRNNVITDEGAKQLVLALVNNSYIIKLQLEMNPFKH